MRILTFLKAMRNVWRNTGDPMFRASTYRPQKNTRPLLVLTYELRIEPKVLYDAKTDPLDVQDRLPGLASYKLIGATYMAPKGRLL